VKLGIRVKLLCSFFVVALFTLALSGYAVLTMERLNERQRTMYVDVFGGTHLLATYVDLWSSQRSSVLQYLVWDDPAVRSRLRVVMNSTELQMRELMQQMDLADTDRLDVQTLAAIDLQWRAYTDWRNQTLALAEAGKSGAAVAAYQSIGSQLEADFDQTIDQFLDRKREVAAQIASSAEATYLSTRTIAIVLSMVCIGSGLLIGLFLARSIATAAHQVARAAHGLAGGELNQRIDVRSRDELGDMAMAFRDMIGYQQEMARVANAIAARDLTQDIRPKSERDVLGSAFQRMLSNLRNLVDQLEQRETHIQADLAHHQLEVNGRTLSILTVRDATERKAAEERAQQLARSDKLRALGQMASGIAHDLNQSLALVAGFGEMAQHSLERGEENNAREYLRTIVQAALDGGQTVKRLLTFTRQRVDGPRERIELSQLLPEIAQLTAPQWRDAAQAEGRRIDVQVVLSGTPALDGWPHALREALTNLLFNAFDALPDGGTVQVSARPLGERVLIEIRDTGTGMPPEVQDRIFEPFFTTKGEGGTGLGLAQVYGIVQQHEGEISVDSEPGRGTTFRLTFPAAQAETGAQPRTVVDTPSATRGPLRILAIDDEPALARMVRLILSKHGHHVEMATSGEEGLACLERQPFDLVITDLGLGSGLTGWQVAEHVRARWPQIQVVLATGWGAAIDEAEARQRGVASVISKPYSAEHLRSMVARLSSQTVTA
jgi:signal transduction histidine kinase/ActR/RegA family two-component response regulator